MVGAGAGVAGVGAGAGGELEVRDLMGGGTWTVVSVTAMPDMGALVTVEGADGQRGVWLVGAGVIRLLLG